jgi:cob(I)alamin adenosyltransferase
LKRGMVHVYTGEGKGKTTAAFGLALRAAGHGLRVRIYQFLKGESRVSGEFLALERCKLPIVWRRFQEQITPLFDDNFDERKLRQSLENAMEEVRAALKSQDVDVLILDEINVALSNGWLPLEDALELIESRPTEVEIVLTGRGAPRALQDAADVVTEMREVKHPFKLGIDARRGIEF